MPPPLLGVLVAAADDPAAWGPVDEAAASFGAERIVALVVTNARRLPRRHRRHRRDGVIVERLGAGRALAEQLHGLRAVLVPDPLDGSMDAAALTTELMIASAACRVPLLPLSSSGTKISQATTAATDNDQTGSGRARPSTPSHTAPQLAELRGLITGTTLADVDDLHRREQIGVRLRRALLNDLADVRDTTRAARTVSVIMATNRPDRLVDAMAMIDAQRPGPLIADVEVVMAVHGELPETLAADLRARATRPLTLLAVEESATLGTVLNRAVAASSGDLITKMDDDDFYAPDHLADLADALDYSGVQLVGKGSEFVYLAAIDTTIRRFPHGVETANRNLAGGTLMIARRDLDAVGGWQDVPRAVDQALIDDVIVHGGDFLRTHGLGFILNRHGHAHTWDASVDYFLGQSVDQWPGIAFEAAGWSPADRPVAERLAG